MRGFDAIVVNPVLVQPPQPPMVTLTSFLSMNTEPSFIFATAMTFWVLASRIRVVAESFTAHFSEMERGDRRVRVAIGKDDDRFHQIVAAMALSTLTDTGTVLPFSAISGVFSVTLPFAGGHAAGEVHDGIFSVASVAAFAGPMRPPTTVNAAAPTDRPKTFRLVSCMIFELLCSTLIFNGLLFECAEIGQDILDLLRSQDRLADGGPREHPCRHPANKSRA
jgi:hypothetical protein